MSELAVERVVDWQSREPLTGSRECRWLAVESVVDWQSRVSLTGSRECRWLAVESVVDWQYYRWFGNQENQCLRMLVIAKSLCY